MVSFSRDGMFRFKRKDIFWIGHSTTLMMILDKPSYMTEISACARAQDISVLKTLPAEQNLAAGCGA